MSSGIKFVYEDNTLQSFANFMVQANRADQKNAIVQMSDKDHIVRFADMKASSDRRGKVFRSQSEKDNNNNARTLIYNAVVGFFGNEKDIPESVKKAMLLDKFELVEKSVNGETKKEATSGKPLRASRIRKIFKALTQVTLENPKLYAKNFISLMLAIPTTKKWDEKYQNQQLAEQANLFFDNLFPAEVFSNVTDQVYKNIVQPAEGEEIPENPGEELKNRLKEKLTEAIDAYKDGKMNWTQKLSDVLYTACRLLDDKDAERCKAVAKEIDTYYTKEPVNPEPVKEYAVEPDKNKKNKDNKMKALSQAVGRVLNGDDKEGIDPNAKVVTADEFQDKIDSNEVKLCKSNPFQFAAAEDTAAIAKAIADEMRRNGEEVTPESILIQIASDRRMCCGGILKNFASQEESVVRNMDPKTLAPLAPYVTLKLPKVVPGTIDDDDTESNNDKKFPHGTEFVYNKDGLDNTKGFMLKSKVACTYYEKINEPFDVQLLYDSMPSFSNIPSNFDSHGTLAWMKKSLKLNSGLEINETQEENALKIIEKVQDSCKKYKCDRNDKKDIFKDLMMILTFGGQNSKFNIFSSKTEEQTDKLYKLILSGDYKKMLATAQANYEKTVSEMMKGWVIMARESGTKYFLGTSIGGSAFYNDKRVVARLMAEAFIKYGGDMKYVFCQHGSDASQRQIYQDAFKEAYQRLSRNTNVFTQQPAEELSPLLQDAVVYRENGIKIPDTQIRNALPEKLSLDVIKTAPKKWAMKILSGIKKIAISNQDNETKHKNIEEYLKTIFESLFSEKVKKLGSVAGYIDYIDRQMSKSVLEEFVDEKSLEVLEPREKDESSEAKGQLYLTALAKQFVSVENDEDIDAFYEGMNAIQDVLKQALLDFIKDQASMKIAENNRITADDVATVTTELQMNVDDIEVPEEEPQQQEEQDNVNNRVDDGGTGPLISEQEPLTFKNKDGEEEIPKVSTNNQ